MNELLRYSSAERMLPRNDGGDDQRKPAREAKTSVGHRSIFTLPNVELKPSHAMVAIVAYAVFVTFLSAVMLWPRPKANPISMPPPIEAKDQAQAPKGDREPARVIPIYRKAELTPEAPEPAPVLPAAPAVPAIPTATPVAPAPPPDEASAEEQQHRRRTVVRHWHDDGGDICARHHMHKVTRGRGWRCVR